MQVYVREQGAVVRKRGGQLQITKGRQKLQELPLMNIEQIILMGNVQLTTQAAKYMLRQDIDVVFLSTNRVYIGRLDKTESRFANLRRQQYRLVDDPQRSLELARQMIVGKINNQRVVLQRRADEDARAAAALKGMLQMLRQVETAASLDSLRGFEGKAAAFYFEGVRTFFPANWGFKKREYYPPPDPANSLLSFAYTLLLKDVKARLHMVGLDPAFGFFHTLEDRRPSLALDVMEEFRPSIADVVVLTLVLNGDITLADFERTDDAALPVRLSEKGVDTLVAGYEERLSEKIFHPMAQGSTPYRNVIEYQARQMRWIVEGRAQDYETVQLQ
jgi:CRISPR-associated protein Cas1